MMWLVEQVLMYMSIKGTDSSLLNACVVVVGDMINVVYIVAGEKITT